MTVTAGFCMAWAPGKAEEMDWRGKRAGPAQWPAAQFTLVIVQLDLFPVHVPVSRRHPPPIRPGRYPASRQHGAAARALKTMGLARLVLVAPKPLDEEAFRRSAGAEDVLGTPRWWLPWPRPWPIAVWCWAAPRVPAASSWRNTCRPTLPPARWPRRRRCRGRTGIRPRAHRPDQRGTAALPCGGAHPVRS